MFFLIFSFYGALSAFIAVIVTGSLLLRFAKRQLLAGKEKEKFNELFDSLLDNAFVEQEVEAIIGRKLDDLILVFKAQIPMASTFLVGSLAEKLKKSAQIELMKILPDMKKGVKERLKKKEIEALFIEKIFDGFIGEICRSHLLKIACISCAVGALLGVVEGGLLYFLSPFLSFRAF